MNENPYPEGSFSSDRWNEGYEACCKEVLKILIDSHKDRGAYSKIKRLRKCPNE